MSGILVACDSLAHSYRNQLHARDTTTRNIKFPTITYVRLYTRETKLSISTTSLILSHQPDVYLDLIISIFRTLAPTKSEISNKDRYPIHNVIAQNYEQMNRISHLIVVFYKSSLC